MADLRRFPEQVPRSDEAPAVLLHLANANEFNAEEKEAREQYAKLVEDYAGTDAGKKAAGALRRIDLVGKPLAIKGTGLQNETSTRRSISASRSWSCSGRAGPPRSRQDLPELIKALREVSAPRT